jgi:hypothetical protein
MMRTRRWVTVPAALIAVALSSAAAQDRQSEADLRCLVVALAMGNSADPNVKNLAPVAAMYYIGRIEGHDPKLSLEASLSGALMKMSAADRQTESRRCGADLSAKGKLLSEIGANLQKQGL